jgi:hypothetical protein
MFIQNRLFQIITIISYPNILSRFQLTNHCIFFVGWVERLSIVGFHSFLLFILSFGNTNQEEIAKPNWDNCSIQPTGIANVGIYND